MATGRCSLSEGSERGDWGALQRSAALYGGSAGGCGSPAEEREVGSDWLGCLTQSSARPDADRGLDRLGLPGGARGSRSFRHSVNNAAWDVDSASDPAALDSAALDRVLETVSPDGKLLVVNTRNGSQLYDSTNGTAIGPPIPSQANITTGSATFSDDAKLIAVPRGEGGAYVWEIDPETWRRRACEIAGHNLTAAEWAQFLPDAGPLRATCPQWALAAT